MLMHQIIYLLLLLIMPLSSCKDDQNTSKVVKHITVEEARSMIDTNEVLVVIDVRTPEEFAEGTIPKAINIDVKANDFLDQIIKLDKEKTYLLSCRSGKRSARAAGIMEENGFKYLYNMKGGYLQWQKNIE
jgi:rhodanese-related sulfurtransferase